MAQRGATRTGSRRALAAVATAALIIAAAWVTHAAGGASNPAPNPTPSGPQTYQLDAEWAGVPGGVTVMTQVGDAPPIPHPYTEDTQRHRETVTAQGNETVSITMDPVKPSFHQAFFKCRIYRGSSPFPVARKQLPGIPPAEMPMAPVTT
jgi:hypothetical protein